MILYDMLELSTTTTQHPQCLGNPGGQQKGMLPKDRTLSRPHRCSFSPEKKRQQKTQIYSDLWVVAVVRLDV